TWLRTEDVMLMGLCGVQALFLMAFLLLSRGLYRRMSPLLLNNTCMLLATGFIMLNRISPERALRQFILVLAGAFAGLFIPVIIDHVWQLARIPWVYGIGGLLLLLVVCVAGSRSFGAQLSITVGGFSFQPSEFVKLSFVFFVATMFYRSSDMRGIIRTTALAAAHVLVLVLSRDLGSALIFFVTYVLMLYLATGNAAWLIAGFGSGSFAAVLAYRLFSHVRIRVEAWQDPFRDISGNGYQVAQGLFAIGTGGWFGMGLYQGMPRRIPVVEKDFIFAAISEELGGLYALCLILICLGCFLQFMQLAMRMDSAFYRQIAFGLGIIYIVQVFLTIGGVIKFIPSTGVTLPFVSYGGSSVLSSFLMFGVIQGLYILKETDDEEMEEEEEEEDEDVQVEEL
nr:FtsW/RodA/SpoVE family cell cycle protein [Clostridium sp.]